jgi:hypothetical protein
MKQKNPKMDDELDTTGRTETTKTNQKKKHRTLVPILVTLALLCVASGALVGILLHDHAAKEQNVISLVPDGDDTGDEDNDKDTTPRVLGQMPDLSDVDADQDADGNQGATGGGATGTQNAANAAAGAAGADQTASGTGATVTGYDDVVSLQQVVHDGETSTTGTGLDGDHTTETVIPLFSSVYYNDKGEIVAQSDNGDNIIAPGTGGQCQYTLSNGVDAALDYTMAVMSNFTVDGVTVPIQVRLKRGNTWVLGSDNTWADPSAMASVDYSGVLDSRNNEVYTFYWQWPYESETTIVGGTSSAAGQTTAGDSDDTKIGDRAVTQDIVFNLDIQTYAEADADTMVTVTGQPTIEYIRSIIRVPKQVAASVLAKIKGSNGDGTLVGSAPKTSDVFAYVFWVAVLAGLFGSIILLIGRKRKKRGDADA